MENALWKRRMGLFAPDQLQEQDWALFWEWCGCTHGLGMTQVTKLCTAEDKWVGTELLCQARSAGQPPASPFAPCSLWLFKTQTCSVVFHVGVDRDLCAFGFLFPSLL